MGGWVGAPRVGWVHAGAPRSAVGEVSACGTLCPRISPACRGMQLALGRPTNRPAVPDVHLAQAWAPRRAPTWVLTLRSLGCRPSWQRR